MKVLDDLSVDNRDSLALDLIETVRPEVETASFRRANLPYDSVPGSNWRRSVGWRMWLGE